MESFKYLKIDSLKQFFESAREIDPGFKILAGGTDLLVKMRVGSESCKSVIDISEVAELIGIKEETDCLRIGACTPISEIANSKIIKQWLPSLATAASLLGSPQIRNRATVGGNINTASPAADTIPPLMIAGAKLRLKEADAVRELGLNEFLLGPGLTKIKKHEILTEVIVPKYFDDVTSNFIKVGRRKALACSVVNMAGWIKRDKSGRVEDLRIVLGAVGPTAFRSSKAEEYLKKEAYSSSAIKEAAKIAASESMPISDIRSTAEGRKYMIEGWTLRLLEKLYES